MEKEKNSVTARWCGTAEFAPVLKLKIVVAYKMGNKCILDVEDVGTS